MRRPPPLPLVSTLLGMVASALGCAPLALPPGVTPPDAGGAALDYRGFVCDVMPTLIRRCSYLECHGQEAHALRVYSAGKLRLSPTHTRLERDAILTEREVLANYESAVGVLLGASPAQRAALDIQYLPLLQRPLAAREGGDEHQGVALFPLPPAERPSADPDWNRLAAWVAGKSLSPADEPCAALFAALNLTPP